MTDLENDRAAIGGNNPPSDLEILLQRLEDDHPDLARRRKEIEAQIAALPETVEDEAAAGTIGDIVLAIRAWVRDAEERRDREKAIFEQKVAVVRNFFQNQIEPVGRSKRDIEWKLSDYQRRKAEEARRVAAEAKRLAEIKAAKARAEAAAAEKEVQRKLAAARKVQTVDPVKREELLDQAETAFLKAGDRRRDVARAQITVERATAIVEAKPSTLSRTRGSLGSVQSLSQRWDAKIVNEDLLPRKYMSPDLVALRQAVNRAKGKIEIPGVEIVDLQNVTVR